MKLDGNWNAVEAQLGGQHIDEEFLSVITLAVTGESCEVHVGGNTDKGTLKYFSFNVPMGVDIAISEGKHQGKTIKAIYKMSGGYLFVCYNIEGADRPKTFISTHDNQYYLVRYKKAIS